MLRLLIFRFWPVLIPLAIYVVWFYAVGRKTTIDGMPVKHFRDGPWYRITLASLLIAVLCFILWGSFEENRTGHYIPPHTENGTIIPGHVEPQP